GRLYVAASSVRIMGSLGREINPLDKYCPAAFMGRKKKSRTINETARRADEHFRFSEAESSEKSSQTENISVFRKPKSALHNTHPVPARGAYHDRRDRGAGRGGRWQCR